MWAGLHAEHTAGERLSGAFGGRESFVCGGDEERGEIGAAESAGRDALRGEVNRRERFAGAGVDASDATAVPKRDPEMAVGVDAHAIGQAVVVGERHERERRAQGAVGGVPAEAIDAVGERIDEIEFVAGGVPRETIAAADIAEATLRGPTGVERIKGSERAVGSGGHDAGPQSAGRIAFSVVAAKRGVGRFEMGEIVDAPGGKFDGSQRRGNADDENVGVVGQHDEAERRRELEGVAFLGVRIEPVKMTADDIDPVEASKAGVPNGTFAEFRETCCGQGERFSESGGHGRRR